MRRIKSVMPRFVPGIDVLLTLNKQGVDGWDITPGHDDERFDWVIPRADSPRASNQLHPLQTRMPILADDDVVMHRYPERVRDVDDRLRHVNVGL